VVANFSDSFLSKYKVPNFPATGIWHEWMDDDEVEAGENQIAINLPEYTARVLVWQPGG
jgi:1,4-alpha-glucan branching enzyme